MDTRSDWSAVFEGAMAAARSGDWLRSQELSAAVATHSPPVAAVSRLNILICQYHLRHYQLIPERALPLLQHLPPSATLACLGLVLLAANRTDSLPQFKTLALAIANPVNQAIDLPSVPTFVMLQNNLTTCMVVESPDASLMSEVCEKLLSAEDLADPERAALKSLRERYLERALTIAAHDLHRKQETPTLPRKWWKPWS